MYGAKLALIMKPAQEMVNLGAIKKQLFSIRAVISLLPLSLWKLFWCGLHKLIFKHPFRKAT